LRPDVAVIPECAEPDVVRRKAPDFAFRDSEWTGEQANKGLGVFSFGDTSLHRDASWDKRFHIFMPIEVRAAEHFNLLAVWAFNGRAEKAASRSGDTGEAVDHYGAFVAARPIVIAGDFNASVYWDDTGRYANFRALDSQLRALGLESGYHATHGCALGAEPDQTHFHVSKRAFHIDYIYVPQAWRKRARTTVAPGDDWRTASDHVPLLLELG
jgi:endonuclease/exonuclease/phosphatase family metal-dependent hydrolase